MIDQSLMFMHLIKTQSLSVYFHLRYCLLNLTTMAQIFMSTTLYFAMQTLVLFLFSMSLLPWLLKRRYWAVSVILPIVVFLIFAQFNPNDFDFIGRLWRGLGIGVLCVIWGIANFYLSKRAEKVSTT